MPSADELPDDLAPLARRNAFELHDSSWREEIQRLIPTLDRVLEGRRSERMVRIAEDLKILRERSTIGLNNPPLQRLKVVALKLPRSRNMRTSENSFSETV